MDKLATLRVRLEKTIELNDETIKAQELEIKELVLFKETLIEDHSILHDQSKRKHENEKIIKSLMEEIEKLLIETIENLKKEDEDNIMIEYFKLRQNNNRPPRSEVVDDTKIINI